MLPKWAFGYIQSKERYKTQEEILSVADEFKKRDIPLGCIVLDWLSWEDGKWGNMHFDKSRFPDARKMVDELHSKGVAFMISVWPNRKEGCEDHKNLKLPENYYVIILIMMLLMKKQEIFTGNSARENFSRLVLMHGGVIHQNHLLLTGTVRKET